MKTRVSCIYWQRIEYGEAVMMDMRELCEVGGPNIWQKVAHRLRNTSPYLTQVCNEVSIMLEMNEKSKEGWHTAHIAGHSDSNDIHRITAADGIALSHCIERAQFG
jgi:hypothetical protein